MISKNILFDKISTASSLIWEKYLNLKIAKLWILLEFLTKHMYQLYELCIWLSSYLKFNNILTFSQI